MRIASCYAYSMPQLVTRVDDQLADAVDELIASGLVASRSEAVRLALEQLIDRHRRDATGAQIADAYTRVPQSEEEMGWSDEATVRMIADEPW